VIEEGSITLGVLGKIFHLFSNNIDWEIFGQHGIRFEKSFKSYSNDQWQLYREQTWFNMTDILHALMLNWNIIDEMILIIMRNGNWRLIKPLITFLIFRGTWHVARRWCTWSSNINKSVV